MNKPLLLLVAVFALLALAAPDALATMGAGGGLSHESSLEKIQASLTGPIPCIFALAGIIDCGTALVLGSDMNGFLRAFLAVIIGVCILIGAPTVISAVTGKGSLFTAGV